MPVLLTCRHYDNIALRNDVLIVLVGDDTGPAGDYEALLKRVDVPSRAAPWLETDEMELQLSAGRSLGRSLAFHGSRYRRGRQRHELDILASMNLHSLTFSSGGLCGE